MIEGIFIYFKFLRKIFGIMQGEAKQILVHYTRKCVPCITNLLALSSENKKVRMGRTFSTVGKDYMNRELWYVSLLDRDRTEGRV
jgi:hypothetical protein